MFVGVAPVCISEVGMCRQELERSLWGMVALVATDSLPFISGYIALSHIHKHTHTHIPPHTFALIVAVQLPQAQVHSSSVLGGDKFGRWQDSEARCRWGDGGKEEQ